MKTVFDKKIPKLKVIFCKYILNKIVNIIKLK